MKLFLGFIYTLVTLLTPLQGLSAQRIIAADLVEGIATEKNYLGNKSHFEKNALGVNAYADLAGAYLVDATGGSPNTTCTRSATAPLAGDGSLLITKAGSATRQGEGCSINFSIDNSLKGGMVRVVLDYAVLSGTYADGDIRVQILDVTNNRYIEPVPTNLNNHTISTGAGFSAEFQASIDSSSYRIAFHISTVSIQNYVLKLDDIKIGKVNAPRGPPVTDWTARTCTSNWTSNVTVTCFEKRVGDVGHYRAKIFFSNTSEGSVFQLNLPSGRVIDTTKINGTIATGVSLGSGIVYDAGANNFPVGVWYASTTSVQLFTLNAAGTYAAGAYVTHVVPVLSTIGINDEINFEFSAPITGWSSSVQMSDSSDTRVAAAYALKNGAQALSANTTTVTSWTVQSDTHGAMSTTGTYTIPVAGWYEFGGRYTISTPSGTYGNLVNINSVGQDFIGNYVTSDRVASSTIRYMLAGQTLVPGIYSSALSGTVQGSASDWWVKRISGSSSIAATETIAALYRGIPTGSIGATWNTITYPTRMKDSHSSYSGGIYTIQSSGTYSISAMVNISATFSTANGSGLAIYIDDVEYMADFDQAGGAVGGMSPNVYLHSVPLLAGQNVRIKAYTQGTSPSYTAANQSQFSIVRTGNY